MTGQPDQGIYVLLGVMFLLYTAIGVLFLWAAAGHRAMLIRKELENDGDNHEWGAAIFFLHAALIALGAASLAVVGVVHVPEDKDAQVAAVVGVSMVLIFAILYQLLLRISIRWAQAMPQLKCWVHA